MTNAETTARTFSDDDLGKLILTNCIRHDDGWHADAAFQDVGPDDPRLGRVLGRDRGLTVYFGHRTAFATIMDTAVGLRIHIIGAEWVTAQTA
jgi:hypothetical protein